MTSKTLILTVSLAVLALPLHAAVMAGDALGTTEADIRLALENSGYVVHEIETEDDEIEIEATLDGANYEIEVAAATGLVLEIELDDEDDD